MFAYSKSFLISGNPRGSSCIAVEIKVLCELLFYSYSLLRGVCLPFGTFGMLHLSGQMWVSAIIRIYIKRKLHQETSNKI
jgi:hypothetical protein